MIIRATSLLMAVFFVGCDKPSQQSYTDVKSKSHETSIPKDLTEVEREFINTMKDAFSRNAPAPLVARICWDGVDEMLRDSMDDYLVDAVARGLQTFEFQRVDPETHTERTESGTPVKANLPVKWFLVVYHPSDVGMEFSSEYYLGERGGKIQFTNSIAQ